MDYSKGYFVNVSHRLHNICDFFNNNYKKWLFATRGTDHKDIYYFKNREELLKISKKYDDFMKENILIEITNMKNIRYGNDIRPTKERFFVHKDLVEPLRYITKHEKLYINSAYRKLGQPVVGDPKGEQDAKDHFAHKDGYAIDFSMDETSKKAERLLLARGFYKPFTKENGYKKEEWWHFRYHWDRRKDYDRAYQDILNHIFSNLGYLSIL